MSRVVVIGAGLAGLAAALRLRNRGHDVTVLDPAPPGGKARTVSADGGWSYEWGPHTFTSRAEPLFELVAELGLEERLIRAGEHARARFVVRDGKLQAARPFAAVRFGELLSVIRGLFRRAAPGEGENVRDWVARLFGASLADGPAAAMTVGIWAARPQEIAVEEAFPGLAKGLREHGTLFRFLRAVSGKGRPAGTFTLRGGLGEIAKAAAEKLTILPEAARSIARAGEGWSVVTEGRTLEADVVVVATEAPAAAALVRDIAPAVAAGLGEIRYAPLAVAHWRAKADGVALPHGFGWLSPPSEARGALGTLFVSDLRPDAVPEGARSFATMFGGTIAPGDVELDEQAIRGRLTAEVRALTGAEPVIEALQVVRHPSAVPLPTPGHSARVAALHAALPPGLLLAGAWCGMGAMHEAIVAGWRAADVVGEDGARAS